MDHVETFYIIVFTLFATPTGPPTTEDSTLNVYPHDSSFIPFAVAKAINAGNAELVLRAFVDIERFLSPKSARNPSNCQEVFPVGMLLQTTELSIGTNVGSSNRLLGPSTGIKHMGISFQLEML